MSSPDQITDPDTIALRDKQWREAMGTQPWMHCACGHGMPLRFFFKCLYCKCYFCEPCAEEHFGKTVKQYFAEKTST